MAEENLEQINSELKNIDGLITGLDYYVVNRKLEEKLGNQYEEYIHCWSLVTRGFGFPDEEDLEGRKGILLALRQLFNDMKKVVLAFGIPEEDITNAKLKNYVEIAKAEIQNEINALLSKAKGKEGPKGPRIN